MKRIDTNLIVALAALLTSVVAVWIAWDESRLQRQNQRASFMPILKVESGVNAGANQIELSLSIVNSGLGVAIVETADLKVHGERVTEFESFTNALLTPSLSENMTFSWQTPTGYIRPNEVVKTLIYRWDNTPETLEKFQSYLENDLANVTENVTVELCYCSLFDECWSSSNRSIRPVSVKQCPEEFDAIEALWRDYYGIQNKNPDSQ